jgi:hypothetical protein
MRGHRPHEQASDRTTDNNRADLDLARETIKIQYAGYWSAEEGRRIALVKRNLAVSTALDGVRNRSDASAPLSLDLINVRFTPNSGHGSARS